MIYTIVIIELVIIIVLLLVIAIIVYLFYQLQHQMRMRFDIFYKISVEFKKIGQLKKVVENVLQLIIDNISSVKGGMVIVFGKTHNKKNFLVLKGAVLSEKEFTEYALSERNFFTESGQPLCAKFSIDGSFVYVQFFPLIIDKKVIGIIGYTFLKKRISFWDLSFLRVINGRVSLQLEERLLQKRLLAYSKELSLVEYSYEHIVDNLPIGVISVDVDGQIILYNNAMRRIMDGTDRLGDDYTNIFHGDNAQKKIRLFFREVKKTQMLNVMDKFMVEQDKKVLRIVGYPLHDQQQHIIAYVFIHEDITKQYFLSEKIRRLQEDAKKELEKKVTIATKELVDANKELERLNALKSEFVSTISHELKTPLTSISGYVKLLLSKRLGELQPKQVQSLDIVAQESDRLSGLISDVLDLSRLESGKTVLRKEQMCLHDVIKKVLNVVRPQAKQKNITIVYSVNSCSKKEFSFDGDKIHQVLLNLLSNAVKFSVQDSAIVIGCKQKTGCVEFWVKDSGIGISEQDQEKIFAPFFQVEHHMTRNVGGTGLGLTISKHIVDLHKGKMYMESKLNLGTTVFVELPEQ
ncbi:MAG: sensor histidine kinase [Candidatus Woesearchaeota archaeon]